MCLSRACPRCGGDLFYEDYLDGDKGWECLQCGYISKGGENEIHNHRTGKTRLSVSQVSDLRGNASHDSTTPNS